MTREIDTAGLPPELVAQLQCSKRAISQEDIVLGTLVLLGGAATKDELLVRAWRETGKVIPRNSVSAVLSKLKSQGMISIMRKDGQPVYVAVGSVDEGEFE